MQQIIISDELMARVPKVELSCIECDVLLQAKNELLWNDIQQKMNEISTTTKVENISQLPAISASRKAYKACGKDPARYRLSAEALLRRIVKRNEIYQINNVVDLLNLVSISTGFSIGGYDAEKIEGDVVFGIGKKDEPYTGIGRGDLNVEFMPVFRDAKGAFGSPTSDSVRTSVSLKTKRFLMVIIDYAGSQQLKEAISLAVTLLEKYAEVSNIKFKNIRDNERS
jgi:DNA/RNA-binding domain of Phe-tRNA-synthetase-like protein